MLECFLSKIFRTKIDFPIVTQVQFNLLSLFEQLPPEVLSTGESLRLRFHSDDTLQAKGFSVIYLALDANEEGQIIEKPQNFRQRTSYRRNRWTGRNRLRGNNLHSG